MQRKFIYSLTLLFSIFVFYEAYSVATAYRKLSSQFALYSSMSPNELGLSEKRQDILVKIQDPTFYEHSGIEWPSPITTLRWTLASECLLIVSNICIYYGLGFRSKITIDKALKYTISIPDHFSNTSRQIPFEYITHTEIAEYKLFEKDDYYPSAVNNDYYYRKTMFGYAGAGLIVCYQFPKSMTGDSIVRGIVFPAPKANEFLHFIKENTLVDTAGNINALKDHVI